MFRILVICLLLTADLAKAQQSVPLEISRNGHLMVKARINGVEGNFIFDTGAGLHVVSGKFFEKIKKQAVDSSYFTAFRHTGERLDGPIYQFANVSIGPISQEKPWVGVYKAFDEMGFDGLISCKLIEDKVVTVDPGNKTITLETKNSAAAIRMKRVPVLIHSDRGRTLDFFIKVKVNDRYDAVLEFDTGSGYSPRKSQHHLQTQPYLRRPHQLHHLQPQSLDA